MSMTLAIREETVDAIMNRVQDLQESGELDLPPRYSAGNALKAAWLILQETVDKDRKPVLEVCTRESIANALFNMVLQGLNPAKKQGYFIAYGNKLEFQRSYFGTMAVLRRVNHQVDEIVSEVVYDGDDFKYRIERGKKIISDHQQTLENVDKGKIRAAYCIIYAKDGKVMSSEIMTYKEILQSWKQSKTKPIGDNGELRAGGTHSKFSAEMAKRTVINRCCKALINSSDDQTLMMRAARADLETRKIAAQARIDLEANQGPVLDILDASEPEALADHDYGEATQGNSCPDPPEIIEPEDSPVMEEAPY